jgi:hypothetical protein
MQPGDRAVAATAAQSRAASIRGAQLVAIRERNGLLQPTQQPSSLTPTQASTRPHASAGRGKSSRQATSTGGRQGGAAQASWSQQTPWPRATQGRSSLLSSQSGAVPVSRRSVAGVGGGGAGGASVGAGGSPIEAGGLAARGRRPRSSGSLGPETVAPADSGAAGGVEQAMSAPPTTHENRLRMERSYLVSPFSPISGSASGARVRSRNGHELPATCDDDPSSRVTDG